MTRSDAPDIGRPCVQFHQVEYVTPAAAEAFTGPPKTPSRILSFLVVSMWRAYQAT